LKVLAAPDSFYILSILLTQGIIEYAHRT